MTKRKFWLGFLLFIGVFILSNPSNSDFQNFLKAKGMDEKRGGRIMYFGLFSVFESEEKYIGVFNNFIHIKSEISAEEKAAFERAIQDSIAAAMQASGDMMEYASELDTVKKWTPPKDEIVDPLNLLDSVNKWDKYRVQDPQKKKPKFNQDKPYEVIEKGNK